MPAPFGYYGVPRLGVVDIPEGLMGTGPICLFEDLEKLAPEEIKWVLFMKKKRVVEKDYGWAVEFEEAGKCAIFQLWYGIASMFYNGLEYTKPSLDVIK